MRQLTAFGASSHSFLAVPMWLAFAGCDHGVEQRAQDRHSKFDQEEGFNAHRHAMSEESGADDLTISLCRVALADMEKCPRHKDGEVDGDARYEVSGGY